MMDDANSDTMSLRRKIGVAIVVALVYKAFSVYFRTMANGDGEPAERHRDFQKTWATQALGIGVAVVSVAAVALLVGYLAVAATGAGIFASLVLGRRYFGDDDGDTTATEPTEPAEVEVDH